MSDTPQGEGWWQASDGRWYAPELRPDAAPPAPAAGPVPGDAPPAAGWWRASDGQWYSPEQAPGGAAAPAEPEAPHAGHTGRETIVGSGPPLAGPPTGGPPQSAPVPPPGAPPPGAPPGPPPPGGTGAPPVEGDGKRSKGKLALVVLLVLALAAGAFAVVTLLDDDEADAVQLEPIGTEGADPFTAPTAPQPGGSLLAYADEGAPDSPDGPDRTLSDITEKRGPYISADGTEPGLYGGSLDNTSCDPDQLVDFLLSEQDKADAWAEVLDLDADDIASYVDDLTPAVLGADTRVVNHGFADGRATPRQAVLQRGTAVLVDDQGVPRVRCFCGNPLLEPPVDTDAGEERFEGQAWSSFDAAQVVVVQQASSRLAVLKLVDVETGNLFDRPVGTTGDADIDPTAELDEGARPEEPELATGAIQVTLRWSTQADLDLAVTSPLGETVSFSSPSAESGGELDVDANASCSSATDTPVENIVWTADPPSGTYEVEVNLFSECGSGTGPQDYQLTVTVDDRPVSLTGGGQGTVSSDAVDTYTFEVP